MRRRAGNEDGSGSAAQGSGLPLHRKEAKNGQPTKSYGSRLQRIKRMTVCVKYLSYAIIFLIIILILILRFDTKDRVKHKVINLKNRVLGNTRDYLKDYDIVASLLNDYSRPQVDGKHVVFVTVSNLQPDETYTGWGLSDKSTQDALKIAQTRLPRRTNTYPYVKVDIVTNIKRIQEYNYYEEFTSVPSRWFGIALDWKSDWIFTPEEVHANALVDKHLMLRWERIGLYAARAGRSEGANALPDFSDDETTLPSIDLFQTESVFVDATTQDQDSYKLYHGHRLYPAVDPKLLTRRITDAAGYLTQLVKDTGRQVYKYLPRSDYEPFGYNLSRHAGVVYSMSLTLRHLGSSERTTQLQQRMHLTIAYLLGNVESCPLPYDPTQRAKCLVEYEGTEEQKVVKLGTNAMTLLAVLEYMHSTNMADTPDGKELWSAAVDLANYLVASLEIDSGSMVHKVLLDKNNALQSLDQEIFVRYYQGQVAFALARMTYLAKQFGQQVDPAWTETAVKAADLLVATDRETNDEDFSFDHWLMYAIAELDRAGVDLPKIFVDAVVRSSTLVSQWQGKEPDSREDVDRLGLFYDDISSTATATKTQGLCAIQDLLAKLDRKDVAKTSFDTLIQSIRYQLQTQFQPEEAMYMRDPSRCLGGFHSSILGFELRNDYTQHNVASLVCTAELMKNRGIHNAK